MKRNGLNMRLCLLYLHYILKSVLDDYLHPLNGGRYIRDFQNLKCVLGDMVGCPPTKQV